MFTRFPQTERTALVPEIFELVATRGESLFGQFVVVEPGCVRISSLP
jgi:hypothetical protein